MTMLRTKKQELKLCRGCATAKAAHLIGDTHVVLIIRDLLTGPKCFKNLEESLEGVSTRTLTNKLKIMEKAGVIKRAYHKERPPRVEYSLTKKGLALRNVLRAMKKYGEAYL
jgi:DNA-binding HxlR family transcriptional regulator